MFYKKNIQHNCFQHWGSFEMRASKYISAASLLRNLLHVLQQFQRETSSECHWNTGSICDCHIFFTLISARVAVFVLRCFRYK